MISLFCLKNIFKIYKLYYSQNNLQRNNVLRVKIEVKAKMKNRGNRAKTGDWICALCGLRTSGGTGPDVRTVAGGNFNRFSQLIFRTFPLQTLKSSGDPSS